MIVLQGLVTQWLVANHQPSSTRSGLPPPHPMHDLFCVCFSSVPLQRGICTKPCQVASANVWCCLHCTCTLPPGCVVYCSAIRGLARLAHIDIAAEQSSTCMHIYGW